MAQERPAASKTRTRSVGTKLAEDEYAWLESIAAAAGKSVSEWAREALLAATTPNPNPNPNNSNDTVLGEVRALRAIVLNLFYDLANGEQITVGRMQEIIARADAKKGQPLKGKPIPGGNGHASGSANDEQ